MHMTPAETLEAMRKKAPRAPRTSAATLYQSYLERTRWHAQKRSFYYLIATKDEWQEFKKDDFREYLAGDGFFDEIMKEASGEKEAKNKQKSLWNRFTHEVWATRQIDWVGELAGWKAGEIQQGNDRALILKGPKLPKAVKGDCKFTLLFLSQLLGPAYPHFIAWLARARRSIQNQKHSFGHVLILIGPTSCGKSCCQHAIITPQLGGRSASIYKQLTGLSRFNKNANAAEHRFMDDHSCATSAQQRLMEEAIKREVSNMMEENEGKGIESFTTRPIMHRLSISINDEPHNLSSLPTVRSDNKDKELLIGCCPAEALSGFSEEEIAAKLQDEENTFAYHLDHFTPPAELIEDTDPEIQRIVTRFGFKSYLDPKYVDAINRESPAEQLRDYIHGILEGHGSEVSFAGCEAIEDRPSRLFSQLKKTEPYGSDIRDLCGNPSYFGRLIAELAVSYPEEFQIVGRSPNRKKYRILKPIAPATADATSPAGGEDKDSRDRAKKVYPSRKNRGNKKKG
jgi:hypothetical protein